MIRPAAPADTPLLLEIARGTEVFQPPALQGLREVLEDYHAGKSTLGHRAVCLERDGQTLGFAYYAPAALTDRTWYLYWIAVVKQVQASGIGRALLRHVEEEIQCLGGRLFFIETSSLPPFEPTRRFYIKNDYERTAVLRDYYAEGDHMVVFRKRIPALENDPGRPESLRDRGSMSGST